MLKYNYVLEYIFILGLVYYPANCQLNKCIVSSSASITVVDCINLKLSEQNLPLDLEIPSTSSLVVLNLSNCTGKIDESSFANIDHLQSINLENSALDKFVLPNKPELKDLDITNSQIPLITKETFKHGQHLKNIAFSDNRMDIKNGAFENLISLTSLDIEHQNVTLNKGFFKGLKSLIILSLVDVTIQKISRDTFEELPELLDLNLDRNPLQTIETGALDPLKKLKNLNILENQLQSLDVNLFKELKNFESLRAPAAAMENFDLRKFLEYCPRFSNFDFSLDDCGRPEISSLQTKVDQLNEFVFVYFDGISRPDRC